ncbi:hypothetical protein LTR56_025199 [Elasticomyces elasticus]|nr:hypothetical protein LTR56_025199 [Elasticomyces elasticus]KAK3649264.1 hypothetical protein LTR22_012993 [Elasticomyces elasticus]KAK4928202.1 hypothetical protein LTR49_005140 [Elasticomyces elasticus]KAK5765956.1 hypothetical protein LTS12_003963 [Elasticomyces elasticus]
MLAQEIEAVVKPIKLSIEQASNKIVAKIGSQDSNKTLQQGFLSIEQACNKIVAEIGYHDTTILQKQGFESIEKACIKIVEELGIQDSNDMLNQGFTSIEQRCDRIVAKIGGQESSKTMQQGFLSIEQACNKIVAKLGKQESSNTAQQAFNVREQILDNARILWPILEAKRCRDGSSANCLVHRVTPPMTVVVAGSGTAVYAAVLRHEHERTGNPSYQFMRSIDTDSAEKAVHMLLDVTMVLMEEEAEELMQIGTYERKVAVAGKGCWY